MSKMVTWLSIMGGITLLAYYGGLIVDTPTNALLNLVFNPSSASGSNTVLKIIGMTNLTIGVVSTLVTKSFNSDLFIMVAFANILLAFGWNFMVIFNTLATYGVIAQTVGVLIFGPIIIMFLVSGVEWWRGISA